MGFYITFVFISIWLNAIVSGQIPKTTNSAHTINQELEYSLLRYLLDDVNNLKNELKVLQNALKKEKEDRLFLEKEVNLLKNVSCRDDQNISEILQLFKSSLTFELDLELKQQRNDILSEISRLQTEFETKIGASTSAISGIIATITNLEKRGSIYFSAATVRDIIKTWVSDEIIIFSHIISSKGGGYDASTGIFTAPKNGVYVFMCHLASVDLGFIAKLVVNGAPKVGVPAAVDYRYDATSLHMYSAGSNSLVYPLQQGDRVWMAHLPNLETAEIWTHTSFPYSAFSGYLLA